MTSQIVTNDELTNLIQERWANRQTGERTEFANQLARKLIKKLVEKLLFTDLLDRFKYNISNR